jgi:hypothetical protein
MAKQKGIIKLEGTIGDISFFKSVDGYQARERTGVSAERIATDPTFDLTRLNGLEFGTAARAARTVRTGFAALLKSVADRRLTGRMIKTMIQILRTDPLGIRGERRVENGTLTLLEGFEFNANASLLSVMKAPYTVTVNRTTGAITVAIPAFVPKALVDAPTGAMYYRIVVGVAAVDFVAVKSEADTAVSTYLPYDYTATTALSLVCNVAASSTAPILVGVGIQFSQLTNGTQQNMNDGTFNALSIVTVDV